VKAFILGIIVTLACVAIAVYIYFSTGMAPVATSAQAMPFEKRLANMALRARVQKEMPKNPPMQPTEADYTAAAHEYVEHCAICHGLPGKDATAMADGMFPKPPQLFKGKGVTDDPPGETYWKIQNGIRLSGMAAFKGHLSDGETWQVAFLLANANKLPASVQTYLQSQQITSHGMGESEHAEREAGAAEHSPAKNAPKATADHHHH
jgi:thiosulfate dehydrogenase